MSSSSAASLSSAFLSANRGPLTTIFTPPASCLSETTLVSFLTTISSSSYTTTKIFVNHYSWGDAACYPSTIATISGSTRWNNGYYYSPGICPSGWTSACQARTNAFGFSTTLASETNAVMCCPSNWDCVGGSTVLANHGCSTALASGQTLTSVWPAPAPTPQVPMNLPSDRSLTGWAVPTNTSALCDAIPVLWQKTDVQILSLLGAAITQSSASGTISGSNTQSTPTQPGSSTFSTTTSFSSVPSTSSSLSAGAKAAIGVTIPLAILALIAGIFLFFRRRNKKNKQTHHELPTSPSSDTPWNELSGLQKMDMKKTASELDSGVMHEADAGHGTNSLAAEMGNGEEDAVHELPGEEVAYGIYGISGLGEKKSIAGVRDQETGTAPP